MSMKRFKAFHMAVGLCSFACFGQSISSVSPSNGDVGQELIVTITCASDSFLSCIKVSSWPTCVSTVNRVYFKNGDSVRVASSVSNVQNASLKATIGFPLWSPPGLWDVAVEHQTTYGGGIISLAQAFTVNPVAPPVLDSIYPKTSFLNRNVMITVYGTHTHFRIFQKDSMVNNVTNAWLKRDAVSIKADSVKTVNSGAVQAWFSLTGSIDTGICDIQIDQGSGLEPAVLARAFYLKGVLTPLGSLPKGCIAYYPFDADAADYSNNGNDGSISNATDTTGMYGQARYFNGSNGYVSVPDNGGFQISNGISICAWIKPVLGSMWYRVVGKTNATNTNNDWVLGEALAGGIYFSLWKGGTQYSTNGKTALSLNAWNHIAGTWDGSVIRIYQNGILQPDTVPFTGPINSSTNPLLIGKLVDNTYYFKGAIDEVMIFNRALTAAELDSVYRGAYTMKPGSDPTIPVLVPCQPKVTLNLLPKFYWRPVKGASVYTLNVARDISFTNIIVAVPQTDTSYTSAAAMPVGTIFWRVKSDLSSRWPAADKFIIQSDTVPFLFRFSRDTVTSLRPKFVWNRVKLATAYRIEIAATLLFTNAITVPISDTTFSPPADLTAGRSYWHVSCDRNYSLFSPPDSFMIALPTQVAAGRDPFGQMPASLDKGSPACELWLYSLDGRRAAMVPSVNSHTRIEDLSNAPGVKLSAGIYLAVLKRNGTAMVTKRVLRR
jgi:hypothetical protein